MAEELIEIRGKTFQDEVILVDGTCFVDCILDRCDLRYHGGPVTFQETTLTACSWSFGDAAHRTLNLLQFFGLEVPLTEVSGNLRLSATLIN